MPAEWEPHEATWLAWPHNPEDWPGKFQAIPWLYAEIVRLLSARERVHILVNDAEGRAARAGILERAGAHLDQVSFHLWPTDRSWTRDSGPIFVRNAEGRVALTHWRFNALGQILELEARRAGSGSRGGAAWFARVATVSRIGKGLEAPDGS